MKRARTVWQAAVLLLCVLLAFAGTAGAEARLNGNDSVEYAYLTMEEGVAGSSVGGDDFASREEFTGGGQYGNQYRIVLKEPGALIVSPVAEGAEASVQVFADFRMTEELLSVRSGTEPVYGAVFLREGTYYYRARTESPAADACTVSVYVRFLPETSMKQKATEEAEAGLWVPRADCVPVFADQLSRSSEAVFATVKSGDELAWFICHGMYTNVRVRFSPTVHCPRYTVRLEEDGHLIVMIPGGKHASVRLFNEANGGLPVKTETVDSDALGGCVTAVTLKAGTYQFDVIPEKDSDLKELNTLAYLGFIPGFGTEGFNGSAVESAWPVDISGSQAENISGPKTEKEPFSVKKIRYSDDTSEAEVTFGVPKEYDPEWMRAVIRVVPGVVMARDAECAAKVWHEENYENAIEGTTFRTSENGVYTARVSGNGLEPVQFFFAVEHIGKVSAKTAGLALPEEKYWKELKAEYTVVKNEDELISLIRSGGVLYSTYDEMSIAKPYSSKYSFTLEEDGRLYAALYSNRCDAALRLFSDREMTNELLVAENIESTNDAIVFVDLKKGTYYCYYVLTAGRKTDTDAATYLGFVPGYGKPGFDENAVRSGGNLLRDEEEYAEDEYAEEEYEEGAEYSVTTVQLPVYGSEKEFEEAVRDGEGYSDDLYDDSYDPADRRFTVEESGYLLVQINNNDWWSFSVFEDAYVQSEILRVDPGAYDDGEDTGRALYRVYLDPGAYWYTVPPTDRTDVLRLGFVPAGRIISLQDCRLSADGVGAEVSFSVCEEYLPGGTDAELRVARGTLLNRRINNPELDKDTEWVGMIRGTEAKLPGPGIYTARIGGGDLPPFQFTFEVGADVPAAAEAPAVEEAPAAEEQESGLTMKKVISRIHYMQWIAEENGIELPEVIPGKELIDYMHEIDELLRQAGFDFRRE